MGFWNVLNNASYEETKVIVASNKYDCEHLLGKFLDACDFDTLIDSNTDAYREPQIPLFTGYAPTDEDCLFKFRKNVFGPDLQTAAYDGLIGAAVRTNNRGIAAGNEQGKREWGEWVTPRQRFILDEIINAVTTIDGKTTADELLDNHKRPVVRDDDHDGSLWLLNSVKAAAKDEHVNVDDFFNKFLRSLIDKDINERKQITAKFQQQFISATKYANMVKSGIAGYMDRYPRTPFARASSYTRDHEHKFNKSIPYLQALDREFKKLLPKRYASQLATAQKIDSHFVIPGTVFTTLTINENFRTAAHRDAGDLNSGFSNLGVISSGDNYAGGYLILPEYRAAINIRPGDLLLINNHECIHGNTEIRPANKNSSNISRMSVVAYFRENLLNAGTWEYEQYRQQFINENRDNPNHKYQRERWNGVYPGWETSPEWIAYLNKHPKGASWIAKYHKDVAQNSIADIIC